MQLAILLNFSLFFLSYTIYINIYTHAHTRTHTHTLTTIQRRSKVNLSEKVTKKEQKNLHVLVLVTNFSIDDVVSEIKTLYCKPNIRHLPAAVSSFGPSRPFLSLSFTNNQLSSLLDIFHDFYLDFLPFLPPFFSFGNRSVLLQLQDVLFHPYVIKLHENNCSSSMCLELRSSPERLHKIQRGESCLIIPSSPRLLFLYLLLTR